jgi:hypothetical protein
MKTTLLTLSFLTSFPSLFSQKDYVKDYHLDRDIYAFNISHRGKMKYEPLNSSRIDEAGGGWLLPGRFDWIMPGEGQYGYSEGTGLLTGFYPNPIPTAGLLELGYGWMFNNAKAVLKSKENNRTVTFQYGMGVGFGFRIFRLASQNDADLYGLLWPEFSSIISIGDRIELIPKYIFNPIYSGNEIRLRTGTELMLIYRIVGGFSATVRLTNETFRFGEEYTTDKISLSGKAVSRSMQLGFAINIADYVKKFSRD